MNKVELNIEYEKVRVYLGVLQLVLHLHHQGTRGLQASYQDALRTIQEAWLNIYEGQLDIWKGQLDIQKDKLEIQEDQLDI